MSDGSPPRRPRAPAGLRTAGRRLWRQMVDVYELDPSEQTALESACRTADELADLQAVLAEVSTPTVAGSKGQTRVHPLYAEVRQHRLALARLLAAIDLPDDAAGAGASRSAAGRALARQRWGVRGATA